MPVSEIAAALRTTAKRYSHGGPCWCLDGWRPEHGYDHEHDVVCHQAREAISALTALEAGAVLPTQQNQQEPLGDDGSEVPVASPPPVSDSPSNPWREALETLREIPEECSQDVEDFAYRVSEALFAADQAWAAGSVERPSGARITTAPVAGQEATDKPAYHRMPCPFAYPDRVLLAECSCGLVLPPTPTKC